MAGRLILGVALAAALALPQAAAADDPPLVEWSALLPSLTTRYDPSSENDCVAGRTQCVDAVIREMQKRFRPLAERCDHDAIFSLTYLRTTQMYRWAIEDPNFFEDTRFVNHEAAVFARYYFEAYDDWHAGRRTEVPAAWRVALKAADNREVPASGNVALGVNAHVMHDLPFVLHGIGLVKPDGSSRKTDHDRVNRFLNKVTLPLAEEIARRFDPRYDDSDITFTTGEEAGLFQLIMTWRELAWRNAERLANARSSTERARVAAEIEAAAGTQAELLRRSSAYLPGTTSAERDAYCAVHHDDVA